ncbi:MAG TPA: DUF1559 domain-containing protein [Gemmata sp.]|jgi:hypothetical protein|nr:DUF1559 domain-containing protein [Gemmata sp.]
MRMREYSAVSYAMLIGGIFALPAASADDPPPITKEFIATSMNNLKQIVLAFHSYSDANRSLPGDILDKNGKPLLSWRVAILPYLDQAELHKQFKLNEPWDSANNKKLIEKMPKLYAPVRVKAKAGETFYQTMTGEKTLYVDHKPVYTIGTIPDGTSNTGLVYEAGEPVIWSKPADMIFDEKKPVPKLGGLFDGECLVGMGDGYVRHLKKKPDEAQLKLMIMADDGMVIDFGKLDKPQGGS